MMRKAIYLLSAILLCGCTASEYAPLESESNYIYATMENDETKTSVTDEGYFTWSAGDKIWLSSTAGGVEGTLSAGAGTPNATFTYGSFMGAITGRAVYPYSEHHDINENTLSVNLPATYELGSVTSNTNAVMYGVVAADRNLKFRHLAGVMRFEFKNAPVGTNQLKVTLDKKINGTFTANIAESAPSIVAVEAAEDADKTIVFNFDALEEAKDIRIYVPLPTGTYKHLALELNAENGNIWSYSKAVTNTIKVKSLLLMPSISMGGTIGGVIENEGTLSFAVSSDSDQTVSYDGADVFVGLNTNLPFAEIEADVPADAQSWVTFIGVYESNSGDRVSAIFEVERNLNNQQRETTVRLKSKASERLYLDVTITQAAFMPVVGGIHISSGGTANSYIVSESGKYYFIPTKGNSTESVSSIVVAETLWETFGTNVKPSVGDLIKNVKYESGVIVFETPDVFRKGNAVIAAKDASGTILWSWHIWLTDYPEGQVYYNNAGTMMDRNLGATSAVPGEVETMGLIYQWGRKDPFLASSSYTEAVEAASTIDWPSSVKSTVTKGTIEYTVVNPTVYITCPDSPYRWHYNEDNTLWDSEKTIYDPCPAGWRIPDCGIWSVAYSAYSSSNNKVKGYDATTYGVNFSETMGADELIWYPSSSTRKVNGEFLLNKNKSNLWSLYSDTGRSFYFRQHTGYWTTIYPNNGGDTATAYNVRCVKE